MDTTVYRAKRIITMNPAQPEAEAVAVRGDRILGVGSVEELQSWGEHTLSDELADKVLVPGFIEAHSHVMAGGMWTMPYVGYFDRRGADGKLWTGCTGFDDVIERLTEAESAMTDPAEPLLAWGLDPIYFDGERMLAKHLDQVSETRPIFVYHASGHLATVNTAMLHRSEITASNPTPGISLDEHGQPDGELQEPPAMQLATDAFARLALVMRTEEAMWNYAREARNTGATLVTDLGTSQLSDPDQVARWTRVTDDPDYPARVMVALSSMMGGLDDPAGLAKVGTDLASSATAKLRYGIVKIVLDGSIQGFTARITWPHYYAAPPGHSGNGLWLMAPDQVADIVEAFHRAGLTVHAHCNGDQATEVFIDAVEQVLERYPRWDHRHTVQHSQLTTKAQYKRMAALGMAANIFSNHIYYWGDQHHDVTVGPERARGMDACATSLREGVPFSIHCDAPVTPMGHLHTMWCAVNRVTASGRVLGPEECISASDALHAVTLGAAWQLKLDHDIGSIEAGKLADFTVLDDNPLTVDPMAIRDIRVWGTVLGGKLFEADPAS
ncbi:MAG: amidohydrolase [Actinomycetia bacterium]|nr:amidohydrolase [Actinomycetes bacterium]